MDRFAWRDRREVREADRADARNHALRLRSGDADSGILRPRTGLGTTKTDAGDHHGWQRIWTTQTGWARSLLTRRSGPGQLPLGG